MKEMGRLEKQKSEQKSESGQVLVEYILLLVISVALILGLAQQVYRPLGQWVENEMGPYLQCLLDVGELPSLGGEVSGECVNPFAGGNADENAARNRQGSKNSNDSGDSASSSRSGSGGSGGGAGGRGSSSRNRGFTVGGQGSADGAGSGNGSGEQITEKLPESSYFKLRSNNSSTVAQVGGSGVQAIRGEIARGVRKPQTQEERVYSAGELDMAENNKKAKPLIVSPPERKPTAEDDSGDWNFGQYFKFAMIIAIIIAIVLFIGGQISSITKSMEK